MPNYVAGVGSTNPKLMLLGEAPGQQEDSFGIPFYPTAPTGEIVTSILSQLGLSRSEVYITNVVKFRPPMNDFEKLHLIGVDLTKSIQELWDNEIKILKPNCILAIGDRALQAVTGLSGILNYRGSILKANDGRTKVVPTIHPAALFSRKITDDDDGEYAGGLEWTYLKLIKADFARAIEESHSSDLNLPERDLTIAHNSLDLYRFLSSYDKLDKVCTDIESINCVPVCIGFAFNKYHAISVPLLRGIGNIALTDMGDNEITECWRLIDKTLKTKKLVGHNLKYDDYKLSLVGLDCANVYSDTLIKTRVIFPELPKKNLGTISSLWTREPFYKEEGKEFRLGKDKIDRLLLYNGKDCAVDYEVDEVQEIDLFAMQEQFGVPLVDYYYNYMMRKHKFYLRMENNGFAVDLARKKELFDRYTIMQAEVHKRLVDAIGDEVNVKSAPQVANLLYKIMKFKYMKKNPTSEETIVRILANHCKGGKTKYIPILTDLLEERRIRDQKSRYISFTPDFDGTCKTVFNISATETCRSSTGVLKAPLRPKKTKIGLSFHTISKHGRLAKDIRSMLICRPGKVMIQVDSSQAEARVVAVLSEDWELLKAFDEIDIHRRTAGLILGLCDKLYLNKDYSNPIIDAMGKDSPERFCGKKVRHAGNYDMKKGRLMTEFNTDAQKFEINMTVSEWKAGHMLELFHEASPNLRGVFHRDIKYALDSSRVLIDPFGGVRIFNGRLDEDLYKEGFANIPQRTVAHLVQGGALAIEDELNGDLEHIWLSENHDSLTMEVPENNWRPYAMLMKKHLEVPIDFNVYCTLKRDYKLVIPAEVEMSNTHYGKFEKVKL